MITPTVGRVVWYRPAVWDNVGQRDREQPCAALVTYVHADRLVNLFVLSHDGIPQHRTSVPLVQDGDPGMGDDQSYCEWMPYQKSVAKGEIAPTLHAQTVLALPQGLRTSDIPSEMCDLLARRPHEKS